MRLAILFPGQGSQSVGMLSGFAGNDAVARVMARSSEALGEDLEKLISEGPAEKLGLTVNTQPVMLACSVAFYEAAREAGIPEPAVMAATASANTRRSLRPALSGLKTRCRSCGSAPRRCRKRCRWVLAAWPRSSVSRTTRSKPCAVRRQRLVSSNP